ncbi:MAG: NFACT RNA binding domain-containing protein, partial [Longimicrobiales bacterium]
ALYDAARKRERAMARIPKLLRQAEGERARLAAIEARIAAGEATHDEVARLASTERRRRIDDTSSAPYRLYRTSGGREVRVGRSSRANDDLTFRHSSPDDIWLHAESVPGAHVILRWDRKEAGPPAADLHEAAVLAAVHSRARTSRTVPVVWTRRKYVRKPRRSGPGRVTTERAKTMFVEPSTALEKRLRAD